jgi:predicted ATP-grasp superfamily ATP-dependent carboligase
VKLFELLETPDLGSPIMVMVLEGWIDAGMGAAGAVSALMEHLDMTTVATFDADLLLDHRARRPILHLENGVNTGLTWPSIEVRAASDRTGVDFLLLVGAEPDHHWHAFSRAVVDLAMELGVRMVVGLGAYPAALPHTRQSRLSATATTPELADQVGFVRGTIDVPGGVQAAIERRCAEVGLPAVGLWAQVPHYVSAMPYPPASAALVDGLRSVAGLDLDAGELVEEAVVTRSRLDALVADNDEHVAMVRHLEEQYDAEEGAGESLLGGGEAIPSGDELAAELERFLREQGRGDPGR